MKKIYLFIFCCFVAFGCSSQMNDEMKTISLKLQLHGKTLANSAVAVFPEGFEFNEKYPSKAFLKLQTNAFGELSFYAKEKRFFILAGEKDPVVSGYAELKEGKWQLNLSTENADAIAQYVYLSVKNKQAPYCHLAWCRWKFCKMCCAVSGENYCYHLLDK